MDWDDPVARAELIARVGPSEYNRLHEAHLDASVIDTVNGHRIRPVSSRFGRLFMIEGTGTAYPDLDQAQGFARSLPTAPKGD